MKKRTKKRSKKSNKRLSHGERIVLNFQDFDKSVGIEVVAADREACYLQLKRAIREVKHIQKTQRQETLRGGIL